MAGGLFRHELLQALPGIIAQLHDMHLQGFDQEVPVIPAARAGQGHLIALLSKPSNCTSNRFPYAIKIFWGRALGKPQKKSTLRP